MPTVFAHTSARGPILRRHAGRRGMPADTPQRDPAAMASGTAAGFTLMETLVAMTILAVALVIILQQFSAALHAAHVADAYSRGVWHAREKMDELLLRETLAEGEAEGEFGDGYRWRYRIEPAGTDSSPPPPEGVVVHTLGVWVDWEQGSNTKEVDLRALALAPSTTP